MASSKSAIYSALVANLLIAVTKFIAGGISNSSAMISEAIHSLVDTINQLLLLLGIKRSLKKPDEKQPFGYGRELYFWAFIVSILIFGLGGGVSMYQGITHIIHPEVLGDPKMNYIVLSLSIVFEMFSFIVALKAFNKIRGNDSFWQTILKSKDPSQFLVLFEDTAALLGLIIVLLFVYLSHLLEMPVLDGVGSLLVGLLLVGVSSILARESRGLLMGEGVDQPMKDAICRLVEQDTDVVKVKTILSTYQSPNDIVLMLIIIFNDKLDVPKLNIAIDRIRKDLKEKFALVRFVIVQPGSAGQE